MVSQIGRRSCCYFAAGLWSIFLVLGSVSPAAADFEAGKRAYLEGDYETAYREWLEAGNAGDSFALYLLGDMHNAGKGVAIDAAKSWHFWLRAAELGDPRAQSLIGYIYSDPMQLKYYVDQPPVNAAQIALGWTLRAAKNRAVAAYIELAFAYCKGTSVERNPDLADAWHFLAQEEEARGEPPAKLLYRCDRKEESPDRYRAVQLLAMALRQAYNLPLRSGIPSEIDWFH